MKDLPAITILGGGIAGWMAAAAFAHAYAGRGEIRLVELPETRNETLACATLPALRGFNAKLGIDDAVLLREADGAFSLGTRFVDWVRPGHAFFRPFGSFGSDFGEVGFHHGWLRMREAGAGDLADYSLAAAAAARGRFMPPSEDPRSVLSSYDYALGADPDAYAGLLRGYALEHGIHLHEAALLEARLGEDGHVETLVLANGEAIGGDLFLDCSGMAGLLISGALGVAYEDWSAQLPCDRVIDGFVSAAEQPAPCATVAAHDAGWQWRVPLRKRTRLGHVYCSAWQSDADAVAALGGNAPDASPVRSGRSKSAWTANCVAIGAAAGFVDPIGSTALDRIRSAIERLLGLLPQDRHAPAEAAEFNRLEALELEAARDFALLLLSRGARAGSPLAQHFQTLALPDTLAARIDLFLARGSIARLPGPFTHADWLALLIGLELAPRGHHPFADAEPGATLAARLAQLRAVVAQASEAMPMHGDVLARSLGGKG